MVNHKNLKQCPRCHAQKALAEFNRNRSRRDGYQDYCRECQTRVQAKYRDDHRADVTKTNTEWRRQYRERGNAQKKAWKKRNAAWVKADNQKYWAEHPGLKNFYAEERRLRVEGLPGKITTRDIHLLLEAQNGKCVKCGTNMAKILSKEQAEKFK